MRLIKSLFVAITAIIVTTIIGSTFTHLLNETKDANYSLSLLSILGTTAHAEENQDYDVDIQVDANHTSTTSLNTYTPSTVIDENILPTPLDNQSQSPQTEGLEENSVYINILEGLVPISGEDINYEKILGITEKEIKSKLESSTLSIWDIAEQVEEVALLESSYRAIYPVRIIGILEQGLITQEAADLLIEKAYSDIGNHLNTSVEMMLNTLPNQE